MATRSVRARPVRLLACAVGPVGLCWILGLARDLMTTASAALVLVLAVVAASSTGDRLAGAVAAVSSAAWFDFFLTRPFLSFTIADRDDVEVAVLLVVVGLVVTEIALWGRRQQRTASEHAGLVDGIASTLSLLDADPADRVHSVAQRVQTVLDVDAVGYDQGAVDRSAPVLGLDGSVTSAGRDLHVETHGLPTDDYVQVPVGRDTGRLLVAASTRVHRPSLAQRQAAAALARQLALPSSAFDAARATA